MPANDCNCAADTVIVLASQSKYGKHFASHVDDWKYLISFQRCHIPNANSEDLDPITRRLKGGRYFDDAWHDIQCRWLLANFIQHPHQASAFLYQITKT